MGDTAIMSFAAMSGFQTETEARHRAGDRKQLHDREQLLPGTGPADGAANTGEISLYAACGGEGRCRGWSLDFKSESV